MESKSIWIVLSYENVLALHFAIKTRLETFQQVALADDSGISNREYTNMSHLQHLYNHLLQDVNAQGYADLKLSLSMLIIVMNTVILYFGLEKNNLTELEWNSAKHLIDILTNVYLDTTHDVKSLNRIKHFLTA